MLILWYSQCESPIGLPEDVVFGWMVREPQSIVWWSTLYRINASNKGNFINDKKSL